MLHTAPRLVIAGLAGDSGKTLVSLGLVRALSRRGMRVAPFKKGPDYIDAAWMAVAAGASCRNLDTYLLSPAAIGEALSRSLPADLMLVEGNRGLFDGMDAAGTHSTAGLARLLAAPVVVVIDVTKMTRTTAALVRGCVTFDPELTVAGVVLNRVGTARQERVIRDAIAADGGPPVLGAIPKLAGDPLPGRHLGLLTAAEHPRREHAVETAAEAVERHVDIDAAIAVARASGPVELPDEAPERAGTPVRIAVFRDEALSFYYPENLEALERSGARLEFVSPLEATRLPEVDGFYFGGGFPEVHVDRLADNVALRRDVRAAIDRGMPVYAECGGLMYLARELVVDGVPRPMVGALDLVVEQTPRPQGHGYVEAEVDIDNPFHPRGTVLRGHEFHYSRVVGGADAEAGTLALRRGRGVGNRRDGLVRNRVWASYLHVHGLGTPGWALRFTDLARAARTDRGGVNLRGDQEGDRPAGPEPGMRDGIERGGLEVATARA